MSTEPQISPTNETLQEEGLNIKALLFSYLRQWPVIILIVVLGLGAAHLYLRYQPKIFEVKAKILFTNQEKNAIEELSVFSDLGLSNKMGAKLANEIAQLKTPGILRAVVRELKSDNLWCYWVGKQGFQSPSSIQMHRLKSSQLP